MISNQFDSIIFNSVLGIFDRILGESYSAVEMECFSLFKNAVIGYETNCKLLEEKAKVFYAEHISTKHAQFLARATYKLAKIAPLALGISMLTAPCGGAGVLLRVALVFAISGCSNKTLALHLKGTFVEGITVSMALEGVCHTLVALATLAPLTALVSATIPGCSYLLRHYAFKRINSPPINEEAGSNDRDLQRSSDQTKLTKEP